MQIQQLTTFTLKSVPTGQFFARSNAIHLSPTTSNRWIAEIKDTKPGLWKSTYTFLVSETKERFCHCVTLVHDAYSFERAMQETEIYYVDGQEVFIIDNSEPLGFHDSHYFSIEQLLVLKDDIEFINSSTFSGVFTGGTFFKTFLNGLNSASLLVSRNEDGEIIMIQLVLPIPFRFHMGKQYKLVDIDKTLPHGKVVEPMHMTHAMKIIESEGWSIEREKEDEYRIGKFSPAGQDFSIVMRGTTDSEFAASIYDAYQAFDPSTEAYQWLDESGHGTNGAPHDMLDVITDMNYCKDEIYRLYQAVTHR